MDTILIVDDSSFIVEGLVAILKKKYRPLAAYSGEECLRILQKEIPSIIILDVIMDSMDGWETLSRIKENPATRHIPVLMFSAKKISPEEAERHLISLDDFIQKPISPQKIIESIEKVLARRDANRQVTEVWKTAGVSQEKIHEYLALTTSLEVDLSLCQNMKIQYDLASPSDRNLAEFQTVITAVQQRIGQERSLIGILELEMNALHGAVTGPERGSESVVQEIVTPPEPSADIPAATGNQGSPAAPAVMITKEFPPGSAEEVRAVPCIPLLEDELFEEPPGISPEDKLFEEPSGVSGPGQMVSPENNGPEPSITQKAGVKLPVLPDAHPAQPDPHMRMEEPPAPIRVIPASLRREPGTAEDDRTGTSGASLEYLGPPGSPDIISRYEELSENRHLIPADPDIPLSVSDEPLVGAGTDVPMARDRFRSPQKSLDNRSAVTGDPVLQQPATGGRPGRVARLIATLFARKKK